MPSGINTTPAKRRKYRPRPAELRAKMHMTDSLQSRNGGVWFPQRTTQKPHNNTLFSWKTNIEGHRMTNQPTNTTRKPLLFALSLAFAALLSACDKPQADKTAKPAVQATATAAAVSSAPAADGMPNITAEDMGNLARAMHGAANQQPDDAPKDKYGQPYIIGNLGGVPVNLPPSIVELVEYDDSPGFDPEKLRTYDPPTRSYQSIIESLGFDFRNHDSVLYDRNDPTLRQEYDSERRQGGDDWVSINISAGSRYGTNPHALDDYFDSSLHLAEMASIAYVNTGKEIYGLALYINGGTDPKTQRPLREHWRAKDMFVFRDEQGNVQTIIECSNRNIKSPSCTHDFNFPPPMKIRISMMYLRQNLFLWKEIQDKTINFVLDFQAKD